MNAASPLSQLRDIHLPADASIWPLAPGWWVLIALFLSVLLWLALRYRAKHKHALAQRLALAELGKISPDDANSAYEVNEILKRACMSYASREQIAALHGKQWIALLRAQTPHTSVEDLETWLQQLYRSNTDSALSRQFHQFAEQWISNALPPKDATTLITGAHTPEQSGTNDKHSGENS